MACPGGDHGAQEQQADFHFPGSSSSSSFVTCTSRDCESMEPTSVPMGLLQKITNNFSEELLLGQGGYGKVYKGLCEDGQEIAVKLLYNNKQTVDDAQFKREFKNLMVLKHPNIVRLVGYCYETQHQHFRELQGGFDFFESTHKALCFEYMPMGSLQKHLSDEFTGLNWKTRYKIIKGACEGLKYLHEGLKPPICHLDLKPDNILLDKNMDPKLADFGLSKFYGKEQTWITQSPITGTLGYMPPEYLFHKVLSKKFDIFSLGAVMTKIIAGPGDHDTSSAEMKQEFLDQVQRNWRKSLQTTLTSLETLEAQCQQVKTCTEIALSCMEMDRHKRPNIEDIIRDLNKTDNFIENINVYEQDPLLPPASSSNVFLIALRLLEKITDNFSQERVLGQGTHGKVYMGVYDDGRQISVKLLYNNMETIDDKKFIREFGNLMMLKHPNIVQVVGYCYETQHQHAEPEGRDVFAETTHKALCFEYMPNGSLQKHMSDECYGLDWQTRYKIIKGTCEGLKYLHEGLEIPFYHLDLKPDNILLDENMAPKLADYGLSKFYVEEQIGTTQRHVGTLGYMPPEYINESIVTEKFDIFSLGVVMTEIIAGPSGHTRYAQMQYQKFLDQVQGNWRERLQTPWSSPGPLEAQCQQVKICAKIALACMEMDRHKRPSIVAIIHELNMTENFMKKVTCYEQEPSALPASNSNLMDKFTYYEQEPSAPAASTSSFMEMVTYHEQEPSAPPVSTSNVVQPVASAPPSTPSPPPSYIGYPTPRPRPSSMISYVMPLAPPPPPSGGFTEFFRTFIQRKPKIYGHVREFTYKELETATRSFADTRKLGQGAFGVVYRGTVMLQGEEVDVAIKKNINYVSDETRKAFNNEVAIMSPLKHLNIIRLKGWCNKKNNLLLVYELVQNRNLEARLYDHGGTGLVLDWRQRYNILVGIASGLEYLHDRCAKTVLHRDIKPANVMLDMDFNAKLCDFGLVTQLTRAATSRSINNIIGTQGYMDPLFHQNGQVTKASDVYSFGVLLLEVVCGVAPILIGNPPENSLIKNVRECRSKEAILDAAHQWLRGEYDEEIKGALLIGLHCVEPNRGDRPTIQIVLAQLAGNSHNCHTGTVYVDVSAKTPNTGKLWSRSRRGHVREFTYKELAPATRSFADTRKIGQGAFGVVYRGAVMMEGTEVEVAIKKNTSDVSDETRAAFKNEVEIMSPLNHGNIIRLLGWCNRRNNLLLVYELVQNRNLEARLYDHGGTGLVLDWRQRYNILVGIASGLEYLHNKCSRTVLHRDIKPANVMLDMDFNAKLCDFGLVTQLTRAATSRSTNNIIGTQGYMDPSFQQTGKVTRDSDVYSFGVLLLEVVCGVAPILIGNPLKNSLIENVRECHGRNAILDAAHQRLRGEYDEEIKGALLIGLHCVEPKRGDRPTIEIVLSNLVSLTASHVVMS